MITNDNQSATSALLKENADLAIVVGGYNSSNTSHLVELLEQKFPTYFISDPAKIISGKLIAHFNLHTRKEIITENYLPSAQPTTIAITSGASCPDAIVDDVLNRFLSFFNGVKGIENI